MQCASSLFLTSKHIVNPFLNKLRFSHLWTAFQFIIVSVHDYLHGNLPNSFIETFKRIEDSHDIETRQSCTGMLTTPKYNSTQFGLKCICKKCINSRNDIITRLNKIVTKKFVDKLKSPDIDLSTLSQNKLKETTTEHLLSKY